MVHLAKTTYTPVEPGIYDALVENIEATDGLYGPQLKVTFALTDEEMHGRTMLGWASAKYGAKTKLAAWTRAILGEEPDEFDSDALLGEPCRLSVGLRQGDDGAVHNKILDVLPPARRGAPVKVATGAADEPVPF